MKDKDSESILEQASGCLCLSGLEPLCTVCDGCIIYGTCMSYIYSQNAIRFYTCICQTEVSENFTEEIIEQK